MFDYVRLLQAHRDAPLTDDLYDRGVSQIPAAEKDEPRSHGAASLGDVEQETSGARSHADTWDSK